jgi:HEAT repeat protein
LKNFPSLHPLNNEADLPNLEFLLVELTSGDDARAESAIPDLIAQGQSAIPELLNLTHSEDPDERWWAIRVLAGSPHTRGEDLVPLLNDPTAEVRSAAALALCNHPVENAVSALIKTLADPDPLTAGLAANALVVIESSSVPALLEVLDDSSQTVRIRVLRALAEIGDVRAIPAMMNTIEEDSALSQYWAKEGLEQLGLNMVYIKP